MTQENARIEPDREIRTGGIPFLLVAMLLTAMAAGTGWGIRGQYGHETGAMIAGVLASLTLVMLFVPHASSLAAARAAAMMTVAIGIGGSMTYGQTVGLTHDGELVGNWEALRWGLLGLFVKGGLWIGFGGVLLGMGLGGARYRALEIAAVLGGMIVLMFLGIRLLNLPFDPSNKLLPWIYFSDDWYFEPDRELKPRPEIWGGYLFALVGLILYVRFVRFDRLAARMGIIGIIAGGLGFSCGQSIQAFHAWNPELFTDGALAWAHQYTRHFNWWNVMETTFGAIWGGGMAFGLWLNRHLIKIDASDSNDNVVMTPTMEMFLVTAHVGLLLLSEFTYLRGTASILNHYTEFGVVMSALPLIGIVGGRLWPYLMVLPIVMIPIAGKTVRTMSYSGDHVSTGVGWLLFVTIPIGIAVVVATWLITRSFTRQHAHRFAAISLLVTVWTFFGLNTAVFDYAWPWQEWTGRTPNQLVFGVSVITLTIAALISLVPTKAEQRCDDPSAL